MRFNAERGTTRLIRDEVVKHLSYQHPDARFVINYQHRLTRFRLWRLIQLRLDVVCLHFPRVPRQIKEHARAFVPLRIKAARASRLLGKAINHGETEACSLPNWFRRVKRIEGA